jgi:hypothetical protein
MVLTSFECLLQYASDIVCASLAVIEAVVSGKDGIGRSTCEKAIHTIGEIGTNTDAFLWI